MISKELFSKALGVYVTDFYLDSETVVYTYDKIFKENEQYKSEINIYELAHKCKEWANRQNYDNNCFISILYEDYSARTIITEDGFGFNANTEPEAIFKACQWILENK